MNKTPWLFIFFLGWAVSTAAAPPNVVIILADDCTYNDLPLYGGQNARTPNLDHLATQGLTFNRAYLAEAMCQPCRSELYTGRYPLSNGSAWNHSASRSGVKSMPHYLKPLGYRVGLAGKVHVRPKTVFPFEMVAGFDQNCVRNPTKTHDLASIKAFMTRDDAAPFCLVVALVEPHVPWVMGDASQYPAERIKLPPNLADTPRTREDFGKYLAEITYMDGQVGDLLKAIEDAGLTDDTLVLFSSEQGAQFPGCKWTNYDTGLHTALVARWPGHVPVGKRTNALVQYADIVPTLLSLAGGEIPTAIDGASFADVLLGKSEVHRNYAYGMHNNLPEGPAYPIRTICDGEYRYIRNLSPDEMYIEKHLMGIQGNGQLNNPYWGTWIAEAGSNKHTYKLVKRYMSRPAEELYHLTDDGYEMNNLAGNPEQEKVLRRLSGKLDAWMAEQGDPGKAQDTQDALEAARKGQHLYFPSGS
jgi:uncharacterized sulfatase